MTAPAFSEANRRYVASLYRRALKTSLNWYVQRDLWREKALEIRARFTANKNVASTVELRKILENTERELEEFKHPDPYRYPTAPDGSKWERNVPPPIIPRIPPEELDEAGEADFILKELP
ncbi:3219_t:CDS:2 [Paraglomus brasilianum]|uniref:NADH dehydrogenase [ubiquinone] 1 beta subcomplex subunit 9 n=1 Tax=Paraglomus brasilianum TaxID=144538 RepID=A0A9N9AE39_9GLOM|nr:3219_t:CDS:2 [Paraglomus brasilianum]